VTVPQANTTEPWRSPTYPQRVHIRERAQWQEVVGRWSERVVEAQTTLSARGNDPLLARLYAQMLGARDQIADAARRLPMEVGDLYEEDRHRLDEAVAALERLFAQWEAATQR
jgi:hypothetical protein